MTSKLEYLVVAHDGTWSIHYHGHKAGAFASKAEAVEAAARLAREGAGIGYDAEVKSLDEGGSPHEERVYRAHAPF